MPVKFFVPLVDVKISGIATAPTQSVGDNTTNIATTKSLCGYTNTEELFSAKNDNFSIICNY